jgi:ferrous iron transport protein B
MAFNLFSAPCFATIGAMRRELHSTKKMLMAVAFQTGLAWVVAVLIYQIGTWIGG